LTALNRTCIVALLSLSRGCWIVVTGNCVCNAHRTSSDGTGGAVGNAGDCGYFIPIPQSKQDTYTLYGMGKADF
jgi:hypothetical protein